MYKLHTYIHTYMHAYIHTKINTYIHTYTHTYINLNQAETPIEYVDVSGRDGEALLRETRFVQSDINNTFK